MRQEQPTAVLGRQIEVSSRAGAEDGAEGVIMLGECSVPRVHIANPSIPSSNGGPKVRHVGGSVSHPPTATFAGAPAGAWLISVRPGESGLHGPRRRHLLLYSSQRGGGGGGGREELRPADARPSSRRPPPELPSLPRPPLPPAAAARLVTRLAPQTRAREARAQRQQPRRGVVEGRRGGCTDPPPSGPADTPLGSRSPFPGCLKGADPPPLPGGGPRRRRPPSFLQPSGCASVRAARWAIRRGGRWSSCPAPARGMTSPRGFSWRRPGCAHTSPAADGDMSGALGVQRPAASPNRRPPASPRCPGE
uniref:proline-rich protein HaeIII subfamily 1-like n=1 Tax=Jaculus jaculus TaxID=51337 RepID=UPI001E1B4FB1|nr:proline-rich protein HaeIII subfamily 1-like [Jaculus jaculus]